MTLSSLNKCVISNSAYFLPTQRVSSIELFDAFNSEQQYGLANDWMIKEMGIHERRMAPRYMKPSDLAIAAAEIVIKDLSTIELDEIDMVIFCGIERDQPEPATAHRIQLKLGLKAGFCFDVANACFGFIDGVSMASKFIESGAARRALVVTGEVPTRISEKTVEKLSTGVAQKDMHKMIGALSVGDAGGAMLLSASSPTERRGFVSFFNQTESQHRKKCYYKHEENGDIDVCMDMARIVARGFRISQGMIETTLSKLGWTTFDWSFAHQTGRRTYEQCESLKGVRPNTIIKTYPYLGNITTATFPVTYAIGEEKQLMNQGDRIGGGFVGSGIAAGQFGYVY